VIKSCQALKEYYFATRMDLPLTFEGFKAKITSAKNPSAGKDCIDLLKKTKYV